jgi:hypothetical protein
MIVVLGYKLDTEPVILFEATSLSLTSGQAWRGASSH